MEVLSPFYTARDRRRYVLMGGLCKPFVIYTKYFSHLKIDCCKQQYFIKQVCQTLEAISLILTNYFFNMLTHRLRLKTMIFFSSTCLGSGRVSMRRDIVGYSEPIGRAYTSPGTSFLSYQERRPRLYTPPTTVISVTHWDKLSPIIRPYWTGPADRQSGRLPRSGV